MKRTILFLASAVALSAQIEGPRLGLLVDGAQVQTAWGIPGVAVHTPWREVSAKLIAASPKQDYVLGVPAEGPGLLVMGANGKEDGDRLVLSDVTGIEAIAFSPEGSAVAIRRGARVDVVTGLPSRAEITQTFDLSFAPDEAARISISDDGSTVLALVSSGAYLLDANGMTRMAIDGVSAAAFLPKTRDVVATTQDKVTLLRFAQEAKEFAIEGLTAKRVAATSRYAVASDRDFVVVNLASGEVTRLSPDAEPRAVQSAGDVIFFLTDDGWSAVDLTDSAPRLVRIPKRYVPETETGVAQ